MSASPAVSIGVPFFNAERTLADTLRSVFRQTRADWELILVDDGSTDASLALARSVTDPRVRVISDGRHLTLAARLNQIAALARAPLLFRLDADDLMFPRRVEVQARYLAEHPDVDVVGTSAVIVDGARAPLGRRGSGPLKTEAARIATSGLFIHPSVAGRTAWFRENPYCEERWAVRAEDAELWLRARERSTFRALDEALLFYSEEPDLLLRRTLASYTATRALLAHAREAGTVGRAASLRAASVQALKSLLLPLAWKLGFAAQIVARRSTPLASPERTEAATLLAQILSCPVPGLPPRIAAAA